MRRACSLSISAMLLTTLLLYQASWAAQIYVGESRDIVIRSSPTNQSRTIAKVSVGLPAEVLKTQGPWTQIRITDTDGNAKEGWLQNKYLSTHPSKAREFEMENATFKEKVAELQKQKDELAQHEKDLTQQLKTVTEKLDKLQSEYDQLAYGSANYLKIKAEYDSARSALSSTQESVQALMQENENLRVSQKVRWFVTGALVLLAGWIIGLLMGRSNKKRRTAYRF